jgi:hypothetical protein
MASIRAGGIHENPRPDYSDSSVTISRATVPSSIDRPCEADCKASYVAATVCEARTRLSGMS